MTLLRLPILAIAAALLLCCCADRRGADALLDHADTLLFSTPADAVALLDSLPDADLDDARAARRAVLLAKARSKAYQPISPDSSLIAAVNHYEGSDDSLAVQALFYLGEANTLVEDYPRALVNLHDAYELAIKNNETFYAAMAARELATSYSNIFIFNKGLYWALKARELFEEAGKHVHSAWMIRDIVEVLIALKNLDRAKEVSEDVDTALYNNDIYYRQEVLKAKIDVAFEQNDDPHTLALINQLRDAQGVSANYLCRAADIHLVNCRLDSAAEYVELAREKSATRLDSLYIEQLSVRLDAHHGNYERAYRRGMKWHRHMTNLSDTLLFNPAVMLLSEHYHHRRETEALKARAARDIFIISALVALIIIGALLTGIFFINSNLRSRRNEIELLVLRVSALEQDIKKANDRYPGLQQSITELIRARFDEINRLCAIWFKHSGNKATENALITEFMNELHTLRSDEFIADIEALVNRYCDGKADRFRQAYPSLQRRQYHLAFYLLAGFSTDSIAVLMSKETRESIYGLKSKLKYRIKTDAPDQAEIWLKELNL